MLGEKNTFKRSGLTATAGTVINVLCPPSPGKFTAITTIRYNNGGTAHTLTIMHPLGSTTVTATAAAGQKVVNITADPGAALLGPNNQASQLAADGIAANDWVVIQLPDGTFLLDTVGSVALPAITLSHNLPTNGVAAGASFWMFGVAGDSDPWTAAAFDSLAALASVMTSIQDAKGLIVSHRPNEPILVQSNNITAAGTFDLVSGGYARAQ